MKDVRPTSGRVLSALFNILGDIEGKRFLDLFAGTGRVGLEALKRNAEECVFVESVKSRAEEIRKSYPSVNKLTSPLIRGDKSEKLAPHDKGERAIYGKGVILSLDIRRAITWLVKREMKFDIIFADPPYNSGWCEVLPTLQNLNKIFADETVFIIEHSVREPLTLKDNPHNLEIISQRDYGETVLTFLRA